jgi:hypothetical protein
MNIGTKQGCKVATKNIHVSPGQLTSTALLTLVPMLGRID